MKNKEKKVKQKRKRKYFFRRFVKEIKRVRWPSSKTNWLTFLKVVVFTAVFTIVVVLFTTLIAFMFQKMGIN
ncbi:preprotein translocase subunit SecE [Mycoplasma sp. Mirounga ES2805-ORL]|uniref:preprotein translocase subunit SecE n=1 Tax=Mycoplasma sp. Mirounga ES2805-ORL TaxID=754514 RepID=UPI00197CADB5|nr:preprotein translocase subunit SecE [Mycoplasma sp. Mirounga ES2805-ORL]QSF13520.1 preprotein translocase subunit SecE [Mycoplasma sp. Mirounga ES2805-ORL]